MLLPTSLLLGRWKPFSALPGRSLLHRHCLHLETLGPPSASGALEFPSLALDVWLLALVGSHSEVLDGLSGILGSAKENDVASSRVLHCKLIEGHAFSASGLD